MKTGVSFIDEYGNPRAELIEEELNNKRETLKASGRYSRIH